MEPDITKSGEVKKMIFVSKRKNFRLVLKPSSYIIDAYGQKVMIPGLTIEFARGKYETSDANIISAMLKSPFLGNQFIVANTNEEVEQWIKDHPEYAHGAAAVVTGGLGTTSGETQPIISAARSALTQAKTVSTDTASTVEDISSLIEQKIDQKLSPLLEKLDALFEKAESKPKKVFTCPIPGCGQVFRSGIELGEHKRQVHMDSASMDT